MSGIEEAYAKYAKGIGEYQLNKIFDCQEEQRMILANLRQMILNLQEKIESLENREDVQNNRIDHAFERITAIEDEMEETEQEENDEETRSDLEFIKQQLYENYQLLEKIDKYIRL